MVTAVPSASDRVRSVRARFRVDWTKTGTYVDESDRVLTLSGQIRLTSRDAGRTSLGSVVSASCKVDLRDSDGRYNPRRTDSPLYDSLNSHYGHLCPVQVDLGFLDGVRRQFTGVVVQIPLKYRTRTALVDCADRWALLNRKAASSDLLQNKRTDEIIDAFMTAAGFTFPTDLEKSPRTIPWAHLDRDKVGTDLNLLLQADGGLCYFSEDGTLTYKSPAWWALSSDPVETFTVDSFADLTATVDYDTHYDGVVVKVKPRYTGQIGVLWTAPADLTLGPGETKTIRAHFKDPALQVIDPVYSSVAEDSDWIPRTAANELMEGAGTVALTGTVGTTMNTQTLAGSGTKFTAELAVDDVIDIAGASPSAFAVLGIVDDDTLFLAQEATTDTAGLTAIKRTAETQVSVAISEVKAQSCLVTIVNLDASNRAYLDKLQVRGIPLPADRETEVTAGDPAGDEVLNIPSNYYIQRITHGQALADAAYQRFLAYREAVVLDGVPARPHVRVGDRVRVVENWSLIRRDFIVIGKDWEFSPRAGYREKYTLADAAGFAPYSDYYIIGSTPLGGSEYSGAGRAFW